MKKVVVTGATGFIGYNVIKELLSHNVEVVAVVRKNSNRIENIKKLNIKIIETDLEHYEDLAEQLIGNNIDTMYHFAWQGVAGADLKNEDIQLLNVSATLKLIDVCKIVGIESFIGAGSIHENEAVKEILEGKRINNLGIMYKSAKIMAHYAAKAKAGAYGIRFIWPKITNTYGVGENSKRLINTIIRNFIQGISMDVSKADQMYNFIYITDLAKAFYLIGEFGIDGENYVISSDRIDELRHYFEDIKKICNDYCNSRVKFNYNKSDSKVIYLDAIEFDNHLLKRDTGFTESISFEQGIYKTVDWIKRSEFEDERRI